MYALTPRGARVLAIIAALLLAQAVPAQSITVPTIAVVRGDTAEIPLSFEAGNGASNFDFVLDYNPSVVDESGLGVVCTPSNVGLTSLECHIDVDADQIRGIGVNLALSPLASGVFATITLPTFAEAPAGEAASDLSANFAATGSVEAFTISWAPKVNESYCNVTIVDGLVASPDIFLEACEKHCS